MNAKPLIGAVNDDYTTPLVDEDGTSVDVDEILALAIVDENLVTIYEYFAGEVNEVVKEMKELHYKKTVN